MLAGTAFAHPTATNTLAGLTATPDNRVLNSDPNHTLAYSANDNLKNDQMRAYMYDAEGAGRILTATQGSTTASYQYDPFGRRIARTVNGVTTKYLFNQDGNEVAEYDGANHLLRRLFPYPGLTAPLATADAAGNITFYQQDRLGSVIAVLPKSATTFSNTYAYLPYGDTPNGMLNGTSWGYAGYRYDAETGTYHTGARSYDPRLGRFVQADPIGQDGGTNIYAYTGGDPLNATDPSGMNWVNDGGTYGAGYNNNMGGGACGCEGNPEHETMQNYMNQQIAYDSSSSGLLPQPVLAENLPPPATSLVPPISTAAFDPEPLPGLAVGPYNEPYVPDGQLPNNARQILQFRTFYDDQGRFSVGFHFPPDTTVTPAVAQRGPDAGQPNGGYIFSPPGSPDLVANQNPQSAVRTGLYNAQIGGPYFSVYNAGGQTISPVTGRTVGPAFAHYPLKGVVPNFGN